MVRYFCKIYFQVLTFGFGKGYISFNIIIPPKTDNLHPKKAHVFPKRKTHPPKAPKCWIPAGSFRRWTPFHSTKPTSQYSNYHMFGRESLNKTIMIPRLHPALAKVRSQGKSIKSLSNTTVFHPTSPSQPKRFCENWEGLANPLDESSSPDQPRIVWSGSLDFQGFRNSTEQTEAQNEADTPQGYNLGKGRHNTRQFGEVFLWICWISWISTGVLHQKTRRSLCFGISMCVCVFDTCQTSRKCSR